MSVLPSLEETAAAAGAERKRSYRKPEDSQSLTPTADWLSINRVYIYTNK